MAIQRLAFLAHDFTQPLPNERAVPVSWLAARELGYVFKQMQGDLEMMIGYGLLPDPVQRRHKCTSLCLATNVGRRVAALGIARKPTACVVNPDPSDALRIPRNELIRRGGA